MSETINPIACAFCGHTDAEREAQHDRVRTLVVRNGEIVRGKWKGGKRLTDEEQLRIRSIMDGEAHACGDRVRCGRRARQRAFEAARGSREARV